MTTKPTRTERWLGAACQLRPQNSGAARRQDAYPSASILANRSASDAEELELLMGAVEQALRL